MQMSSFKFFNVMQQILNPLHFHYNESEEPTFCRLPDGSVEYDHL